MHPKKQNFIFQPKRDLGEPVRHGARVFWFVVRLIPYLILVFLVIAVLFLIYSGLSLAPHYATIKTVYEFGKEGQNHLAQAEEFIKRQDFKASSSELAGAEKSFISAEQGLAEIKKAPLFKWPYFSNQVVVAEDILAIGENLSHSLQKITAVGEEVMATMEDKKKSFLQIDAETKGRILAVLLKSINNLKDVQRDFKGMSEKLVDINRRNPLFIFNKVIDPLQTNIPKIQKTFDSALTVLKVLPTFAGYPEKKTFLLILENNREMRPSGGFIGTYGILEIANAEIKNFYTDNSYNLDVKAIPFMTMPAPDPIVKYMKQKYWFFRDANWWPDFPTSARKAEEFYKEEGGEEKLDGVIAFTPTVMEGLLSVLGEFTVADLKFNKDNFWDQLQYQVEFGYYRQGIAAQDRKDIIGDLGRQIVTKLYSIPLADWPKLIDIMDKEIKEKQLLIYFHDLDAQKVARENGWAGEVKDFSGDYLQLVDANLAALKTDEVMDRTLVYNLRETDKGEIIAEAKVNYQNTGAFSWKTTRYRSFTRLYAPEGSELIQIRAGKELIKKDNITTENDFGKTAWGVFFEVEPKTAKEVSWSYKLPKRIAEQIKNGEYQLMIQKQPGLIKLNVQLNLEFKTKIKNKEALNFQVNKNKIKHVEVLRTDQVYMVWLEK